MIFIYLFIYNEEGQEQGEETESFFKNCVMLITIQSMIISLNIAWLVVKNC